MDQFYLQNATLYRKLVGALKPRAGPDPAQQTPTVGNPSMIVGARIRPLLNEDVAAGFPCAVFPRQRSSQQRHGSVVDIHDLYNHPRGRPILKSFNYEVDRLFDADASTEEIFDNLVTDLIPLAWDGGIGTLFAYGQTGSGKTFTVSRLEELVADALVSGHQNGERRLHITIIELAGNSAFDLLNSREPISIREDSSGITHLSGANEHPVQRREDILDLIDKAASFRKTASTMKNDASSRSHAICRIRIENPAATGQDGLLYLIDLAGSEVARDVASHKNDRMRETREINISLSALKDCIRGKAEWDASRGSKSRSKKPHVPFRQSSLTRILKHVFDPSSERPCKTVVLACINPSLADAGASKNTLRYAELLRVLIAEPLAAGLDSSALEASGDSRESNKVVGFRKDSRHPIDSQVETIPFKQRIRSGMVVRWSSVPRDSADTSSSDLALVLCSTDSETCHSEGASDETTGGDHNQEKQSRYLCAKVVPGSTANAYEIRIWDQIIISDDMMEAEIILEYDTASRYYYQST